MRPFLVLALASLVVPSALRAGDASRRSPRRTVVGASTMARIPGGSYRPLYVAPGDASVRVASFALDREPVTRAQFLAFVQSQPSWRRDAVRPLFAQRGYLADWPSATNAGGPADLRRPGVNVSWFAAKAFCAAQGKRLPTVDEWELAAAASETRADATHDPDFRRRLLSLYSARSSTLPGPVGRGFTNVYGVRDLHGLVWEWTLDFNGVVVADDSRASGSGQDARDHRLFCASAAIGASDPSDYAAFLRYAMRAALTARSTVSGVGFRCAADLAL